jgi:hypothetical protein
MKLSLSHLHIIIREEFDKLLDEYNYSHLNQAVTDEFLRKLRLALWHSVKISEEHKHMILGNNAYKFKLITEGDSILDLQITHVKEGKSKVNYVLTKQKKGV